MFWWNMCIDATQNINGFQEYIVEYSQGWKQSYQHGVKSDGQLKKKMAFFTFYPILLKWRSFMSN